MRNATYYDQKICVLVETRLKNSATGFSQLEGYDDKHAVREPGISKGVSV